MRTVFLFSAAVLGLAGCRPASEKRPEVSPASVSVQLVAVQSIASPALTPISGVVRASRQGQVAAQVMGAVVALPARLGAKVSAGDVLVVLASAELGARRAQAQAAVNEAERAHAQESRLLAKGAATRDAVADLQDRLAAARANLAAVQASVDHLTVRAPFAGVVGGKWVDVGDLATPGRVLVEVQADGPAEIEAGVPVSFVTLPVGTQVAYEADGRQGRATVKELAAAADARSLNRRVLLVTTEAALASGKPVTVLWPGEVRRRLLVPATAVQRHGQIERVWVVGTEGKLALRLVRTAGGEDGRIEVSSGLTDGEKVVEAPADGLTEGSQAIVR
jgi:membrane fusion protein (multidrug efflux system)